MSRLSKNVFLRLLSLSAWAACCGVAAAKPPTLSQVFPTGAGVGQTVTVQLGGDFDPWPVDLTSFPAGLNLTAQSDKGQVQVTVPAEARCGIYLLRASNAEGASAWRPFVVGRRAEVIDAEDNNDPSRAQQLDTSVVVVNGKLAERSDVDVFSVPLKAGQLFVVSALANEVLGSPMDMTVQVCDEQGFVLMQVDDERNLDPQLVFPVPRDGRYLVRLCAFPADPNSSIAFSSGANYLYRVTLTTESFVDHYLPLGIQRGATQEFTPFGWNVASGTIPLPAEDTAAQICVLHPELSETMRVPLFDAPVVLAAETAAPENPQEITVPAVISGHIETEEDIDTFRFTGTASQEILLNVASRELGFPLDAVLMVSDASGKKLSEVDDRRNDRDAEIRFEVPADGTYDLSIRDLHGNGGLRYAYRLTVGIAQPRYSIKPAADAYTMAKGATLELPLEIDRERRFNETIQVSATGLPEGCEFSAPASEKEGDSAKKILAKIVANCEPGSYRFRLHSQAGDETAPRPVKLQTASVEYEELWLTVTP